MTKFVCSFEVNMPDIGYARTTAFQVLNEHLCSLLMTKVQMTAKNEPGIEYIDNWIEEARQMLKTLKVVEK